jgi:hypothetical protein
VIGGVADADIIALVGWVDVTKGTLRRLRTVVADAGTGHCFEGLSDRGSPQASPPARDVDDQVHDEHHRGEQVPPVER